MDKKFDIEFSARVKSLMDNFKITNNVLALILGVSLKSTNDLMNNTSPWRLKHIVKVAEYFSVPTDFIIFGDKDHIEKLKNKAKYKIVENIKDFLVSEKKFQVYGKLDAEGFFKILENK